MKVIWSQVSLVICVPPPPWETHIPSDMCSPSGKHLSLVLWVSPHGKHICLVICVPQPWKHISLVIHITSDMCFPDSGTHITRDTCFLYRVYITQRLTHWATNVFYLTARKLSWFFFLSYSSKLNFSCFLYFHLTIILCYILGQKMICTV